MTDRIDELQRLHEEAIMPDIEKAVDEFREDWGWSLEQDREARNKLLATIQSKLLPMPALLRVARAAAEIGESPCFDAGPSRVDMHPTREQVAELLAALAELRGAT